MAGCTRALVEGDFPTTSPPVPLLISLLRIIPHLLRSTTALTNPWDQTLSIRQVLRHTMAGAGKQPPEVQEHIKELLEAGFDPTTIHRRLKVGRSSIYRMKRCLQQHGTAYMPSELNKKNGRPKVLSSVQELVRLIFMNRRITMC